MIENDLLEIKLEIILKIKKKNTLKKKGLK